MNAINQNRIIIIGLDGVPFHLLDDLAKRGVMPNTRVIIENGVFRKMASSIPEISSVAWSSIITGANPGEHGIYGFTEFSPNTYNMKFPDFGDLKKLPFWERMEEKSIIINVPSTYPVRAMNGVHISGFVSIMLEKSIWPISLIPKLKALNYRLDVDSQLAHNSMDLFLEDLDKTLDARIKSYRYLWDYTDWQTFMLVFTGTDRLMHFLWDAYEDKNHTYHREFLEHFRKIDKIIGEINNNIKEDDSLIMLSDHGFEKLEKDVYINYLLEKEGFLKFQNSAKRRWQNIVPSTKAFALDPARIYVNLNGKYPAGGVDIRDREDVIKDLEALFNSLEMDGKKVINRIYRKEEIYSGPQMDKAPDLILVGSSGFNLKGSIKADKPADKGIFTGKHSQPDAFLLIKDSFGPSIVNSEPNVSDVLGIIEGLNNTGK